MAVLPADAARDEVLCRYRWQFVLLLCKTGCAALHMKKDADRSCCKLVVHLLLSAASEEGSTALQQAFPRCSRQQCWYNTVAACSHCGLHFSSHDAPNITTTSADHHPTAAPISSVHLTHCAMAAWPASCPSAAGGDQGSD